MPERSSVGFRSDPNRSLGRCHISHRYWHITLLILAWRCSFSSVGRSTYTSHSRDVVAESFKAWSRRIRHAGWALCVRCNKRDVRKGHSDHTGTRFPQYRRTSVDLHQHYAIHAAFGGIRDCLTTLCPPSDAHEPSISRRSPRGVGEVYALSRAPRVAVSRLSCA